MKIAPFNVISVYMTNTLKKVMSWCYKRLSQQGRRDSARKTQPVSLGWILLMENLNQHSLYWKKSVFLSWYLSVYPMFHWISSITGGFFRWMKPTHQLRWSPPQFREPRDWKGKTLIASWWWGLIGVDDIHDIRIPGFVVMKINTTLYKDS